MPAESSPSPLPVYRITVVCLGNICRSPIGEAVLRARVDAAGLSDRVAVDSAGTGDWHVGRGADPRARATLDAHGYQHHHTARQITPDWFDDIDLVLAMDAANYADLRTLMGPSRAHPELRMLRSFDPDLAHLSADDPRLAVPDPYYGGVDDFAEVLVMAERASDGVIQHVRSHLPT